MGGTIHVTELKLDRTTRVPKSVLHLVLVDKGQVPRSGIGASTTLVLPNEMMMKSYKVFFSDVKMC